MDMKTTKCRACDKAVAFIKMAKSGKFMPVDYPGKKRVIIKNQPGESGPRGYVVDTFTPHFMTCTDPGRFRKEKNDGKKRIRKKRRKP